VSPEDALFADERARPGAGGLRVAIGALLIVLGLFGVWDLVEALVVREGAFRVAGVLRGALAVGLATATVLLLLHRSRRRQERLQEGGRRYLESLVHASPEALVTTDARGRLLFVSRTACDLLGRSKEEMVGHRADDLYARGREEAEEISEELRVRGEVRDRQVLFRRADGDPIAAFLSVSVVRDALGNRTGTFAIARPVVPRGTVGPEVETVAAIRELAGSIAHEVRNPLAGLRAAMQVFRDDEGRPPLESAVMTECMAQIHRLDAMVTDLVAFAEPHEVAPSPRRLREVAERAVAGIVGTPVMAGVDVRTEIGEELTVLADDVQLGAALRIVLENAAQAVAGRGTVVIDAIRRNGTVVLRVHDSGPGIDESLRERIFRPFVSTKHKGTGLGLAIARRVLEAHGGTISFECPEDGGTRFLLGLPAVPGDEVAGGGVRDDAA
jgi:PAS domain S-box-containing protein